jgi:hypothetical protein
MSQAMQIGGEVFPCESSSGAEGDGRENNAKLWIGQPEGLLSTAMNQID